MCVQAHKRAGAQACEYARARMHTHIRTHANLYDDCSNPIMIVSNPPGITIKSPARHHRKVSRQASRRI